MKPDALSRYFENKTTNSEPYTILRPEVFINASEMQIEKTVRNALATEAAPSRCPDNKMHVPACTRSKVIQWGHSSRLSGHRELTERHLLYNVNSGGQR